MVCSCPGALALHRLARDMGPLRVLAENGLWYWKGAREAYIRASEMRRVQRAPVRQPASQSVGILVFGRL